jgi:hypothetical protein
MNIQFCLCALFTCHTSVELETTMAEETKNNNFSPHFPLYLNKYMEILQFK